MIVSVNAAYACMPRTNNVPDGRPGWIRTNCPVCAHECWMTPQAKQVVEQSEVKLACTECAIRIVARPMVRR